VRLAITKATNTFHVFFPPTRLIVRFKFLDFV